MNTRRWGCLGVIGVIAVGVLVVLGGAFRPEPAVADLQKRTRSPQTRAGHGYTIGGQVVDATMSGVPGISIDITATDFSKRWHTTTDASGRFALQGIAGVTEVRPGVTTSPAKYTLIRPRTNLMFQLAEHCSLKVLVLSGEDDTSITNGSVTLYTESGEVLELAVDDDGRGTWDEVPCGTATLEARADGHLPNTTPVETSDGHAHLWLQPDDLGLVRVHGLVTAEGQPVAHATLTTVPENSGLPATSGPDGAYSLFVDGPGPYALTVDHHDHQYELDALLIPPAVSEWEHDVELEPARKVKVYCAGLPDDDCHDLPLVMCSEPWVPASYPCAEEAGTITCRCPQGDAAVRGGGESVLVPEAATEAWLDFREPGGLSGQVLVDSEPSRCTLEVVRWTLDLGGGGGLRTHACKPDGSFVVPSLKAGSWRVVVRAQGMEHAIGPIEVTDAMMDLGDIDLMGGVMLAGQVVWEDDETPVAGVHVAAVELDTLANGAAPPVGTATTTREGRFSIFGLEPGRYQVMLPRDPGGGQVVELTDEDVYVELVRAGGSGLGLTRDDDDRLVVSVGDADGWLEPGDRIDAVSVAGIDVLELVPRYGNDVGETLLELVGYPGITVVVERDGQTVTLGEE